MEKYRQIVRETKELETVICDCCGKEIAVKNGMATEDFLHIHKEWGYFSQRDGETDEFDICEDCFSAWTQGFVHGKSK